MEIHPVDVPEWVIRDGIAKRLVLTLGVPAPVLLSGGASYSLNPMPEPPIPPNGNPCYWKEEERVQVEAVLRRARELLRRGWVAGTLATVGREGRKHAIVSPLHPDATHFCLVGSLVRGANDLNLPWCYYLAVATMRQDPEVPRYGLEHFNDHAGEAAVIALFERTIERVRVPK